MIWENVFVDRHLTAGEAAATLAKAFDVPVADVLVVPDIIAANAQPDARVLAELTSARGDFPVLLTIYLRDLNLATRDRAAIVGGFCEALGAACLISDDSVNPFTMLLVRRPADRRPVALDPQRLDADEYVVARTLPPDREASRIA